MYKYIITALIYLSIIKMMEQVKVIDSFEYMAYNIITNNYKTTAICLQEGLR